jgi:hypothetical protein
VNFFVVDYDYGTGSAYVGVLAESAEQIIAELKYVAIIDPVEAGLSADFVQKLRAAAMSIDDQRWDGVRRRK